MSLMPCNLLFLLVGYSFVEYQRFCGNRAYGAGDRYDLKKIFCSSYMISSSFEYIVSDLIT